MVGNNTPVFFIRDPSQFPDFIHTQKRNPQTNCPDPNMFWDFLSLTPESVHQVTVLFSPRGTPDGYRHMNGYGYKRQSLALPLMHPLAATDRTPSRWSTREATLTGSSFTSRYLFVSSILTCTNNVVVSLTDGPRSEEPDSG